MKALFTSVGLGASGITGLVYFKTWRNKQAYLKLKQDEEIRDTTRPNYEFFGLNWGSGADSMVMEMIDSGDLIFAKKDCSQCIEPMQMVNCYIDKVKLGSELRYDDVAIAVRNGPLVNLITGNILTGQGATLCSYADFVSYPFFQTILHRKLEINADIEFQELFAKRLLLLYYELEANKNNHQFFEEESIDSESISSTRASKFLKEFNYPYDIQKLLDYLHKNKLIKQSFKYREIDLSTLDYLNFVLREMGMLKDEVDQIDSSDLNYGRPIAVQPIYTFEHQTIVRSDLNSFLLSDEANKK